ncbi:MAG: DNA polymerase III subunit beta [Clostridia bacterium]|nr:DNA polymerase III subunit beta [Clostridia bacterium]
MKFQCSRQKLNEAVTNVQRAVSTKSTIPALEGILIKAADNKITLCGYDLEIGITTTIDADVRENGSAVLTAKLFAEIIRKMPEDTITIETDEKLIAYISGGKAEYKIIGISDEEYPELPSVNGSDKFNINGGTLRSMISQTIYAVSDKDIKPAHKGSLFEIENGNIKIISVDGYRLAIRTEKIDYNDEKNFIVPGKSLSEVTKLITDEEKDVQITVGDRHIVFQIDNYSIITRLIEGEFMNYKAALPKTHSTEMKVNTRQFINAIERMSLLLTERLKSPIRCKIEDGLIKTSCNTSLGQAYDEFPAEISGEDIEIGFDNKYLLDALRNSETDEVKIQLSSPLSPIVIMPSEGNSFLFLVLPVRLKNEN